MAYLRADRALVRAYRLATLGFAVCTLPITLLAQTSAAGDPPNGAELAPLLKSFDKAFHGPKKADAGESFLHDVELRAAAAAAEASGDPEAYRREEQALRAFAAKALVLSEHHPSEFKTMKKKVAKVAPPSSRWPEVEFFAYAFGTRDLAAQAEDATKLAEGLASGKIQLETKLLPLRVRAADLAHGCCSERELMLAGLLRTLDVDHGAERYARFLDSWRNPGPQGEESFYQALDRTAGTKDSVFFFDIMLSEFTLRYGDVEGSKSLKVAHDHLHAGFLAYRQYRAFLEAVAHALILPHDLHLPQRLARYDYEATKGLPAGRDYSLRHQIDILLENAGGDPAPVIALCQEVVKAHPLPDPLWSAEVDPVFFFGQRFAEQKITSTTEELKVARWKRSEASVRAWRAVVREALSAMKP